MTDWHPCLKQATRCVVEYVSPGIRGEVEGRNLCLVDAEVCPRVEAGCRTGEGYDLCGPPVHAEAAAAALLPDGVRWGTAYLYGHDWLCRDCQHALVAKGIRTFVITGEEA